MPRPPHTPGWLVGKGASVRLPHQLREGAWRGGRRGVPAPGAGLPNGAADGAGGGGQGLSPTPAGYGGVPPPRPLSLASPQAPAPPARAQLPREAAAAHGPARGCAAPPPPSAGPRLRPRGLPGLRCGGPGPGGADSLQAPPLPRLLLRAAAPLQAPAPPRPPLRLPRLPPAAAAPASPG